MDGMVEIITGRERRRRQAREGLLGPATPESPMFIPVQALEPVKAAIAPFDEMPRAAVPTRPATPPGLIEIELGNGRQVRVGSDVNLAALRRVLTALRE